MSMRVVIAAVIALAAIALAVVAVRCTVHEDPPEDVVAPPWQRQDEPRR